jgi:pimeloyl-ACP methyl ester carboxylesterase
MTGIQPPETRSLKTSDGETIYYDYYPAGARQVVVIAHGFFNSKRSVLLRELAAELNKTYDVAVMDFRGHGASGGLFYWTAKEPMDLAAVINDLRPRYDRVGVVGFSLGAATSIITAASTGGIDSLVAVSAPVEFEKIEFHFWDLDIDTDILYNLTGEGRLGKGVRPGPFWLKKDKPLNVISRVRCPVLFIHGEADWLIKPWHSRALYDRAAGEKALRLIPRGPHAEYLIRKSRPETLEAISGWFAKTLHR